MTRTARHEGAAVRAAPCDDRGVAALPESPLVGRDAEVAAVLGAAGDARAGEGRCVVVTGEAGLGKTRLVTEAVRRMVATDDPPLVLVGHATDMTTGEIPFGVVADTVRDLLHQRGPDALTEHEREALAPLLPGEATGRADPVGLIGSALDLLDRLSNEGLLVWVVEDLHWADAATRDLVNLAVRTLRGRILVVLTVRTDDPDRPPDLAAAVTAYVAGLARLPGTVRLDLVRLTEPEVHRQLASLAADLSPARRRHIARLSDGVPFVVEELAAAGDRPGSAGAAVTGRLQRLGAETRRLVDAAAVGDGHLRISLLEQVVDATPEELDAALAEAVAAGVLVLDPDVDVVGFRHALLRDAAHRALGPGARRSWHRRWAEVLEANPGVLAADLTLLTIAEHWHHAGDVSRSLDAAYAAVPAARRTSDLSGQYSLWSRIFECWDHRDPAAAVGRLTLRDAVGQALRRPLNTMPHPVLARFWSSLEGLPLDPATRSVVRMSFMLAHASKTQSGDTTLLDEMLAHGWLEQPPDDLTQAALAMICGAPAMSDTGQDAAYLGRAVEIAEAEGDPDRLAGIAIMRGFNVEYHEGPSRAVEVMEGDRDLVAAGDPGHQIAFAGNLAWSLIKLGRHERADLVLSEQLERQAHLEARPSAWEHLVENATFSCLCTGQWQRARQLVADAAPWWTDDVRLSHLHIARLDLRQHGTTDRRRWLPHLDVPVVNGPSVAEVRGLLAVAAGLDGDLTGMRELTKPVWSLRDPGVLESLWFTLSSLARIEADHWTRATPADRGPAAEHWSMIQEAAARCSDEGDLDAAWRLELAAHRSRIDGDDARDDLEAALEAWERIGHVPDATETRIRLADEHARHGDRSAAREHLGVARQSAEHLEAGRLVTLCDEVAARHGLSGRDRRREDLLTAREAEVLGQLAAGRTNAEIAKTLFMSPKTASVHVSHIIAKLGAANRTEAAAIAHREGLVPSGGGAG